VELLAKPSISNGLNIAGTIGVAVAAVLCAVGLPFIAEFVPLPDPLMLVGVWVLFPVVIVARVLSRGGSTLKRLIPPSFVSFFATVLILITPADPDDKITFLPVVMLVGMGWFFQILSLLDSCNLPNLCWILPLLAWSGYLIVISLGLPANGSPLHWAGGALLIGVGLPCSVAVLGGPMPRRNSAG
jgi:hypothetical protein